jgi:small subunit ribosomal protein S23e
MGAGRKLRVHRREQRWADKDYNRSHLGRYVTMDVAGLQRRLQELFSSLLACPRSEYKKPFAGCSHAKGIVLEKM